MIESEMIEKEYNCLFKTHSKQEYLKFLQYIQGNNWRYKAIGNDWTCEFIIGFDMHK